MAKHEAREKELRKTRYEEQLIADITKDLYRVLEPYRAKSSWKAELKFLQSEAFRKSENKLKAQGDWSKSYWTEETREIDRQEMLQIEEQMRREEEARERERQENRRKRGWLRRLLGRE